jgi:hypothetical protein
MNLHFPYTEGFPDDEIQRDSIRNEVRRFDWPAFLRASETSQTKRLEMNLCGRALNARFQNLRDSTAASSAPISETAFSALIHSQPESRPNARWNAMFDASHDLCEFKGGRLTPKFH